jgi:hypothetical protein
MAAISFPFTASSVVPSACVDDRQFRQLWQALQAKNRGDFKTSTILARRCAQGPYLYWTLYCKALPKGNALAIGDYREYAMAALQFFVWLDQQHAAIQAFSRIDSLVQYLPMAMSYLIDRERIGRTIEFARKILAVAKSPQGPSSKSANSVPLLEYPVGFQAKTRFAKFMYLETFNAAHGNIIQARVGRAQFKFAIDTGSGSSFISEETAKALNLAVADVKFPYFGLDGVLQYARMAVLPKLEIGNAQYVNLVFLVIPRPPAMADVLGLDFLLWHRGLVIDNVQSRLTLNPDARPEEFEACRPIKFMSTAGGLEGQSLVSPSYINGAWVNWKIDTGLFAPPLLGAWQAGRLASDNFRSARQVVDTGGLGAPRKIAVKSWFDVPVTFADHEDVLPEAHTYDSYNYDESIDIVANPNSFHPRQILFDFSHGLLCMNFSSPDPQTPASLR